MNKLHVIIPNYKESFLTVQTVNRLLDKYEHGDIFFYIVDSSPDDKWFHEITLSLIDVKNLEFIRVPHTFFWTRSIMRGIRKVVARSDQEDFLMLLNNDVRLSNNYLNYFTSLIKKNGFMCFASGVTKFRKRSTTEYEAGVTIKILKLKINSILVSNFNRFSKKEFYYPDAISGRGLIMPAAYFHTYNFYVNPYFLPHYWADLYLSALAKKRGYELIVSCKKNVSHERPPSVDSYHGNIVKRYFDIKSPVRLASLLYFWISVLVKRI